MYSSYLTILLTLCLVVNNWTGGSPIAKSMPIPIGPLGGAPFRKNSSYANKQGAMDKVSAAAMRRASYAERDRMRMVDPGALDFDVAEEDEDEESGNSTANDTQVGGKSMQRALNILQKHSEIPGAGRFSFYCQLINKP